MRQCHANETILWNQFFSVEHERVRIHFSDYWRHVYFRFPCLVRHRECLTLGLLLLNFFFCVCSRHIHTTFDLIYNGIEIEITCLRWNEIYLTDLTRSKLQHRSNCQFFEATTGWSVRSFDRPIHIHADTYTQTHARMITTNIDLDKINKIFIMDEWTSCWTGIGIGTCA